MPADAAPCRSIRAHNAHTCHRQCLDIIVVSVDSDTKGASVTIGNRSRARKRLPDPIRQRTQRATGDRVRAGPTVTGCTLPRRPRRRRGLRVHARRGRWRARACVRMSARTTSTHHPVMTDRQLPDSRLCDATEPVRTNTHYLAVAKHNQTRLWAFLRVFPWSQIRPRTSVVAPICALDSIQ